MRKRFFILSTLLIVFTLLFTSKSYAATPLYPVNNIYTEGIYKIPKSVFDSYNIQYKLVNHNKKCTIIILDENNNTIFKSSECRDQCDAGIITNKDTLIIITEDQVSLYFNKV
ncbi:hypothetical protein KDJ93_19855 (plasmid) [Clostridium butyricum]|uniref:hypothetical protein n=1 Tax=Clostridium butyricum TaxID=1492 RepID=UPI00051C64B6|nr:hypothetical protein [Clostridium butyricum]QUF85313.1 hypothetical protein KDJ93_19855 [Clostridium butyricum]